MTTGKSRNQHGLPGTAESYWIASTAASDYPTLPAGMWVDVAVIGGGFVGIMSAVLLKEAGLSVALIEGRKLLTGVTGYTTAKITSLHKLIYSHLMSRLDRERSQQYADSNQAALEKIASMVAERGIDCDFSRRPFYTYAETDAGLRKVEEEVKAAQELRLPATFVDAVPLPFRIRGAVRFDNQAQFHPRKFLLALAPGIPGNGSFIFENTRATDVDEGEPCLVSTNRGTIKARDVIIATNYPFINLPGLYFARLRPERSYAVGITLKERFPEGMFIGAEETGYSFRSQPLEDGELVIVGGEGHKTGRGGDTTHYYGEIEKRLNRMYDSPDVKYSWSTQDNTTIDMVPYIGRLTPAHNHVFVATGFGQWGMTTSVVSAMVLSEMVQGRASPWARVYNPSRFNADTSAAKNLISENISNVKTLFGEHLTESPDVSQLRPGEGKLVQMKGKRAAGYEDEQGRRYLLSPNCVHMQCLVHWNNAEKTWDCPCHGSRYSHTGEVIHAPASRNLPVIEAPDT